MCYKAFIKGMAAEGISLKAFFLPGRLGTDLFKRPLRGHRARLGRAEESFLWSGLGGLCFSKKDAPGLSCKLS